MFQKQNDLEVVLALLKGECHLRGLSKAAGIPPATLKRSVDKLIGEGAIDARISGRNRVFSLKRNTVSREYVLAAEHYKALKCLGEYPSLLPVMEKALRECGGMVVLFGSLQSFRPKGTVT